MDEPMQVPQNGELIKETTSNFAVINFPFLDSKKPTAPAY
jgi:hypothetical protein